MSFILHQTILVIFLGQWQRHKRRQDHPSSFQASAWITCANILLAQSKITWLSSESEGEAECSTHSGKAMQKYMAKGTETGGSEELRLFFAILTYQVTDKEKVGRVQGWTSWINWGETTMTGFSTTASLRGGCTDYWWGKNLPDGQSF